MVVKPDINRSLHLFHTLLFLLVGIHFFLLKDPIFTFLLLFNTLLNGIAYFQLPNKVSDQSIFVNFFNGFVLLISAYNYRELNLMYFLFGASILSLGFFMLSIHQYYKRALYRKQKKSRQQKFK